MKFVTSAIITMLLISVFSSFAFAESLLVKCNTRDEMAKGEGRVRIHFQIKKSRTDKFSYVDTDVEEIFKVTPSDAQAQWLNENGSIRQTKDQVTFFGDADGFVFVYLTLYKNAGYTRGYLRYEDGGAGLSGNLYSTVGCRFESL
jgi:hypothetical protein